MGPGKYERVGKSQSVLIMIDPMISPRTRESPFVRRGGCVRAAAGGAGDGDGARAAARGGSRGLAPGRAPRGRCRWVVVIGSPSVERRQLSAVAPAAGAEEL
eukprot:COSAG01_NODE_28099_length_669_cov_1.045614_1_plen_101_part_10